MKRLHQDPSAIACLSDPLLFVKLINALCTFVWALPNEKLVFINPVVRDVLLGQFFQDGG